MAPRDYRSEGIKHVARLEKHLEQRATSTIKKKPTSKQSYFVQKWKQPGKCKRSKYTCRKYCNFCETEGFIERDLNAMDP